MLIAFLIDEIQELACRLFQAARAAIHVCIVLSKKLLALISHSSARVKRCSVTPCFRLLVGNDQQQYLSCQLLDAAHVSWYALLERKI